MCRTPHQIVHAVLTDAPPDKPQIMNLDNLYGVLAASLWGSRLGDTGGYVG
jgi:hypothetical protein